MSVAFASWAHNLYPAAASGTRRRPRAAPAPASALAGTTPYTVHSSIYTLHPAPYTLHPSPYTLHPTAWARTLYLKLAVTRPRLAAWAHDMYHWLAEWAHNIYPRLVAWADNVYWQHGRITCISGW